VVFVLCWINRQVLVLSGTTSLFRQAVERVNQLGTADITVGNTLVVTNEEHRFLSLEQLREINGINVTLLLGPMGQNTAPRSPWPHCKPLKVGKIPFWWSRLQTKLCKNQRLFKRFCSNAFAQRPMAASSFWASTATSPKPAMAKSNSRVQRARRVNTPWPSLPKSQT